MSTALNPQHANTVCQIKSQLIQMNIPQVLGYTRIAGTPVVTGLYTVLLPLVAFAVFGSCAYRLCDPNVVPMETTEPSD
jgi:hypothetical protein